VLPNIPDKRKLKALTACSKIFLSMANLPQIDWQVISREPYLRSLLEDFADHYKSAGPTLFPGSQLALAVWYQKQPQSDRQHLLMLFTEPPPLLRIEKSEQPLLWNTGPERPPLVEIDWTSVGYFERELLQNPKSLEIYRENFDVLYFQRDLLSAFMLNAFRVITEPDGLIKGWYVDSEEFSKGARPRRLLQLYIPYERQLGLVKTFEAPDFSTCRGIIHGEFDQFWLPASLDQLRVHDFYNDYLNARPGYLLFEAGSLYKIEKFEVISKPKYSAMVLRPLPDDRYPEVYLRTVRPPD
jgi:hypothetical protein